eukprot:6204492-Pleurochrysis_carterae.AAC.1
MEQTTMHAARSRSPPPTSAAWRRGQKPNLVHACLQATQSCCDKLATASTGSMSHEQDLHLSKLHRVGHQEASPRHRSQRWLVPWQGLCLAYSVLDYLWHLRDKMQNTEPAEVGVLAPISVASISCYLLDPVWFLIGLLSSAVRGLRYSFLNVRFSWVSTGESKLHFEKLHAAKKPCTPVHVAHGIAARVSTSSVGYGMCILLLAASASTAKSEACDWLDGREEVAADQGGCGGFKLQANLLECERHYFRQGPLIAP